MTGNLTIGALLEQGARRLQDSQAAAGRAVPDAEVLLAHVLSLSRAQIRSHPERTPGAAAARRFDDAIGRRIRGEPVAYIIGQREFWSITLSVTPAVLVPRPETELLVERALTLWAQPSGRVADLGTGSGAVAIAVATERPRWHVTATDLSADALAIARSNGSRSGRGKVEWIAGSWFEPLAGRQFDLVLSNPPYVADSDPALLQPELQHEPQLALLGGPDGLSCLRTIIQRAPGHVAPDGWLVLEHGLQQAADVRRELVARGFGSVRSHRDLAGHERVTEAQWLLHSAVASTRRKVGRSP